MSVALPFSYKFCRYSLSKVTIIASVYHLFAKIITIFNIRKFAAGYSISAQNFAMPGVAEKAGSGTDKIIKEWKESN
jgi:hypothetical protein